MSSAEGITEYDDRARQALLGIARGAIQHGLDCGAPPPIALDGLAAALCAWRASFVTLTTGGGLRGCIGSLEACQPLAEDVAGNAVDTAFSDPRFAASYERYGEGLAEYVSEAILANRHRD